MKIKSMRVASELDVKNSQGCCVTGVCMEIMLVE